MKLSFYHKGDDCKLSWEIFSDRSYPCPCGESTYREVTKTDDWNRTKEDVTMNCNDCSKKYEMKYYQTSNGEIWRWEEINKTPKKKMIEILGTWVEID